MKKEKKKAKLLILLSIFCLAFSGLTACGLDDEDYYDDYEDYDDYDDDEDWDEDWDDDWDSDDEDDGDQGETSTGSNGKDSAANEDVDADSFTLMMYICGSNLESEEGAATADLTEMMYSEAGDKLKIVVETGGASEWQNDVISGSSVQRYLVSSEGLELLEDEGNVKMMSSDTMADFINYSVSEYPADRYGFIFWDHGGGPVGGYGGDENDNDAGMTIEDIVNGFDKAGQHFDFIGFDCCLMGTVEIASALSPYGDYLVASEETEPGTGWYYTDFLNIIEDNPGASIMKIGSQIVDDFVDSRNTDITDGVTLSLIDLSKIATVKNELDSYLADSENYLVNKGYSNLAKARSGARSYGNDGFEQIDIVDYVNRADVDGSKLVNAINDAVLYNGTNMAGSNGLAMFYPYLLSENYSLYSGIISNAGFGGTEYSTFFNDFVTVQLGGQASGGGNSNPYAADYQGQDYSEVFDSEWFNEDIYSEYQDDYSYVDGSELTIDEKGDGFVLSLSDDEWDLITDIQLQVYVDDGEGYLDLGSDDFYEFDDDGDLIVGYDYNWLFLDGKLVPYYAMSSDEYADGTEYSIGYIPAVLNEQDDIYIWILWEEEATVLGFTYNDDGSVASKGYCEFETGDVIDFPFEYYDYDGNYVDSYYLTDNTLVVDNPEISAYYDLIDEDYNTQVCFYLKDIYQNEYWTEAIVYEN